MVQSTSGAELTSVKRAVCSSRVIRVAGIKAVLDILPLNTITKSWLSRSVKRVEERTGEALLRMCVGCAMPLFWP